MARKILYVEDDPDVFRAMMRLIRSMGFEVLHTTTVREAWRLFQENHNEIGIILLDGQLEDDTSLELVAKIKGTDFQGLLVACSGGEGSNKILLQAGCKMAFLKRELPEKLSELLDAL